MFSDNDNPGSEIFAGQPSAATVPAPDSEVPLTAVEEHNKVPAPAETSQAPGVAAEAAAVAFAPAEAASAIAEAAPTSVEPHAAPVETAGAAEAPAG
jgi:hypothetical protein